MLNVYTTIGLQEEGSLQNVLLVCWCPKFRLLETAICCNAERTDVIIQAVCVLYNFIRIREGVLSNAIRPLLAETTVTSSPRMEQGSHRRPSVSALELRNRLCQYFYNLKGHLPWQEKYTV
jgi:hypothetical protein